MPLITLRLQSGIRLSEAEHVVVAPWHELCQLQTDHARRSVEVDLAETGHNFDMFNPKQLGIASFSLGLSLSIQAPTLRTCLGFS